MDAPGVKRLPRVVLGSDLPATSSNTIRGVAEYGICKGANTWSPGRVRSIHSEQTQRIPQAVVTEICVDVAALAVLVPLAVSYHPDIDVCAQHMGPPCCCRHQYATSPFRFHDFVTIQHNQT